MASGDDGKRKKRIAIIGFSSILLVAMVVAVTVGVGDENGGDTDVSKKKSTQDVSASVKAVKAICQPTKYTKTCEENLEKHSKNVTDPKELIKVAFKVAENLVSEAAKKSATLKSLDNDPRTHDALQGCKELLNMSVGELQNSFKKVSDISISGLETLMHDLKTWLSASITYQQTCLEGFQNTTTDAGEKMKKILKISMEMSTNGLGIVDGLANMFNNLNFESRRLLQDITTADRVPSWVHSRTRMHLSMGTSNLKPNLVIAKDGSGNATTINAGLNMIPKKLNGTFVIYIKAGVYNEIVTFNKSLSHLVVYGDGPEKTRITGNKNFIDGVTTYHTATVAVHGDYFFAKNIGFENSAGPTKHQAVALRVSADYAVFYNCNMDGYQDTLYAHTKRQFYRGCKISGTIDFVFGNAISVFQDCQFLIRKPLSNQQNIVTAQGRTDAKDPTGIVIQNCKFTAHSELSAERKNFRNYLGRPWKEYSRTIILNSFIDDLIHPDGWLPWAGDFGLKTCWYTELNNRGPGANKSKRVKWPGIKTINRARAAAFSTQKFLGSTDWIPAQVPHN